MFAPTRILAPVDFSGTSDASLHRAIDLAARTGAELHVLHVAPGSASDGEAAFDALPEEDRAFYRRLWNGADDDLTALLDRVPTGDVHAKRVLSRGHPSRVVLDYAEEEEEADLIVMGTQGRRGLRRLILGSVAGEVLRRARVPVMVVPEEDTHSRPLRLVLAPTDFSDPSRGTLPVAAGLASLYGADLDLVHAYEPLLFVEAMTGVEVADNLLPDLLAGAGRRLEALAKDPDLAAAMRAEAGEGVGRSQRRPARIGHHVVEGRAAEAIVEVAQSRGADAIVMAKRGLHGVDRLLLGSVTERVCRLSPCPVLVVPIWDRRA